MKRKAHHLYNCLIASYNFACFAEGILLPIYAIYVQKIGGDILQGKKSILILTALQDLDPVNQHKLLNDYKLKLNDEDKLAKIGQWFEQLDIKNKVSKCYLSYQEKCEAIIQQMECESWQKRREKSS